MACGTTESGSKLVTVELAASVTLELDASVTVAPAASLPAGPNVAAAASVSAGRSPDVSGAFMQVVLVGLAVAVSFLNLEPAAFKPAGSPPLALGLLPAVETDAICLR